MKSPVNSIILLAVLSFAGGCAVFGLFPEEEPEKIFSLHEISFHDMDSERLNVRLPDARADARDEGGELRVRLIPLLHSRHVVDMDVVSGYTTPVALRLYLSDRGRRLWMQIHAEYRGQSLAVALDGRILFIWTVPSMPLRHGEQTVLIDGPWKSLEAEEIAAQAGRNYELLNR